jgi:histidyl-tRNA synthetase
MRFKPLTGFRDFLPADMAVRRWIESAWHRASRAAGFEEWDGPVLESLELFKAKSGDEIEAQLYAFADRGDREVALRPEMTPTLARLVGARAGGLPKPIKWYCVPQFYRYERPQRGRGREFVQWNIDVVGSAEAAADAEPMAVAVRALELLGLDQGALTLRVNDRRVVRRLLRELEIEEADEPEVLACMDKLERDRNAGERLRERVGAARASEITSWCKDYPLDRAAELEPVLEACEDFGLAGYVQPDMHIVRGLAYYTGPVWELFDIGRSLRSLAGGGRYDELIATLGGPDLPAVGFGMGDMVLTELVRERGLVPATPSRVDVWVVAVGAEMERPAREVIAHLRRRDVAADGGYTSARVAKGLRSADQAGARRAVIVGPDEWAEGRVKVKDLASGEEQVVRLDDLQ